ncbi:MAG: glycosyltransferase family 4 protein, partial [Candidatus Buchananbacteria bacterium]|nr:glycosyltransferase family 4 protein [Candidatus Buchananbacteria bacterium]
MKIAIFSFDFDRTYGTGNFTYEYCNVLYKKGIDFVLFLPSVPGDGRSTSREDLPFSVKYILPRPILSFRESNRPMWIIWQWYIWQYFKTIDLTGFSLVHCLFEYPLSFMAARCAKKNKLPFIMGAQGTYAIAPLTQWPAKYLLKWSYNQAKEIIVPSQFTKDKIIEYAKKDYNISIIHNGIDFSKFENELDISELKNKYANKKILITVGKLISRKGHDLVIKALAKIKDQYPDIKYLIIGDGQKADFLKKITEDLKLNNQVDFLGRIEHDNIIKYFHLCDIYVHTPKFSKDLKFEGFGIVYLEASACGKPIVASDAGGIRDAVIDGKTGLIARNEDVDDIADKIVQLLDNDNLRLEMGKVGRVYAKEHDWSNIVDKFIDKY